MMITFLCGLCVDVLEVEPTKVGEMTRSKYTLIAVVLVALMTLAPILAFGSFHVSQAQPVTITIGALLPLTGDLQSYGERAAAAVQFAVDEMNQYLEQQNAWFRLQLVIEDTQTKPDVAVQKFSNLAAQGIKFIVGPMTSAEVKKIKDLANQQNVLIISPSSTAIELAIPGDNVFRFCPADDVQSKAIAKVLEDAGIKVAIIVNRADTWGEGLKDATKQASESKGITIESVYSYNAESPNFASIVTQLNNDVQNLLKQYKPNEVAIVVIGFNEVAQLFTTANKYPDLKEVPWYGSDGTALLTEITSDPVVAGFAEATLFLNPIFSPASTAVQEKVKQAVVEKLGTEPDAYSYAAHDAVVAITMAILQAGETNDMDQLVNQVKQLIPQVTTSDEFAQFAATGKFPLNDAGDRATADYDWWLVASVSGGYKWVKAGTYKGLEDANDFIAMDAFNGKTYLEIFQETFAPAPATTTTTAPATTAPAAETETTTTAAGGVSTGLIVAVIIIIIVVAAAFLYSRK